MNRDAAATLSLCKWLRERIKEWEAVAKADLGMLPGDRVTVTVGDVSLGTVTYARGSKTVRVVDEQRLLEFVCKHAPDEVDLVPAHIIVRPAYLAKILAEVKARGALVDPDGVIHDGIVEVLEGEPYPIVKPTPDAGIVFAGLLKSGRIGESGMRAIGDRPQG